MSEDTRTNMSENTRTPDLEFDFARIKQLFEDESFETMLLSSFEPNKQLHLDKLRLSYIMYLFQRCKDLDVSVDTENIWSLAEKNLPDVKDKKITLETTKMWYEAFRRTNSLEFFKAIERITRGQSENILWHVVRDRIITGSQIDYFIKTGNLKSSIMRLVQPIQPFMNFGQTHEPLVKKLLTLYVTKNPDPFEKGMGVLIDPASGVFAASLDMCDGVTVTGDVWKIEKEAKIYEIKCRASYTLESTISQIADLIRCPDEEHFIRLVQAFTFPLVEYREHNRFFSVSEYLVTHDKRYDTKKKRRTLNENSKDLLELIKQNTYNKSTVMIFDAQLENEVYNCKMVAQFTAPIFFNPRHPYLYQGLLQYYVVSQYYISDCSCPERIVPTDLPKLYFASAIFRKRPEKLPVCAGDKQFIDCELPLILIVTPVTLAEKPVTSVIRAAFDKFQTHIHRETNRQVWEPGFLNGFVASHYVQDATP